MEIIKKLSELIYNKKYGEKDFFNKELDYFYNNAMSSNIKILSYFINNVYSASDFDDMNLKVNIETIKKSIQRMDKDNLLDVQRLEGKKKFFTISEAGVEYLKQYLTKEFINKNNYILQNIRINRDSKLKKDKEDPQFDKKRVEGVMDLLDTKNSVEDFVKNGFFVFDVLEILEIDIELGEYIINDFASAYSLFKLCIKDKIPAISKIEENIENIKFINIDKIETQKYKISDIPKKSNEFINTKGILIRRNPQIREEVTKFYYLCFNPSCPHSEDKIKSDGKVKACPKCKSNLDLIDRKIKKVIDLDIKDTDNDTTLKIKCYDNLIEDVCNLKIGEEISVNGHIKLLEPKNKDTSETYLTRIMILNNLKSSSNSIYLSKEEEEEVTKVIENLQKNNISVKDYLLSYMYKLYPYHPRELFDLYLVPQLLNYNELGENIIHILCIGSPNTYKSSFLKFMSYIFPKTRQLQLRQLSTDKFYGGVRADGLTDVGLAMTQRGGSLILDEIDKDTDSYDKSSNMLNQVMSDQEASKERVGASIHLKNVNMRIYGIMNHNERYLQEGKVIAWINKQIHDSTLTRFFLVDFNHFVNKVVKEDIIDKMASNNTNLIKDYDFEIRKKVIIHLRNQEVSLELIKEDIKTFLMSIFNNFNNLDHLTRNIQEIKNIIIGLCRLKGVTTATKEELQEAILIVKWTYSTQGMDLSQYLNQVNNSITNKRYWEDVKHCSYSILEEIRENNNTNTHNIEKVLSESFSIDIITKSFDKLKQEGNIFEPKRNEWRIVGE